MEKIKCFLSPGKPASDGQCEYCCIHCENAEKCQYACEATKNGEWKTEAEISERCPYASD